MGLCQNLLGCWGRVRCIIPKCRHLVVVLLTPSWGVGDAGASSWGVLSASLCHHLSAHVGHLQSSTSPQPVVQMQGIPSALLHHNASSLLGVSSKLSIPTWWIPGAVLPHDPSAPFWMSPGLFFTTTHPPIWGVPGAVLHHNSSPPFWESPVFFFPTTHPLHFGQDTLHHSSPPNSGCPQHCSPPHLGLSARTLALIPVLKLLSKVARSAQDLTSDSLPSTHLGLCPLPKGSCPLGATV